MKRKLLKGNSTVESSTDNRVVEGATPSPSTKKQYITIERPCYYCNGGAIKPCFCNGTLKLRHKEQLLLCLGGQYNGQYRNETFLVDRKQKYKRFNNSYKGRRKGDKEHFSSIWVHETLLSGPIA